MGLPVYNTRDYAPALRKWIPLAKRDTVSTLQNFSLLYGNE